METPLGLEPKVPWFVARVGEIQRRGANSDELASYSIEPLPSIFRIDATGFEPATTGRPGVHTVETTHLAQSVMFGS